MLWAALVVSGRWSSLLFLRPEQAVEAHRVSPPLVFEGLLESDQSSHTSLTPLECL